MATIRAYTTIEQSRKLTKILPIETADMFHFIHGNNNSETIGIGYEKASAEFYSKTKHEYLACWSLAALLGLLPKRIEIADNVYELSVYLYGLYYWNVNNGNLLLEVKGKDNLVDSCVAMIEKLNELKML
jgi:hypothetical protein